MPGFFGMKKKDEKSNKDGLRVLLLGIDGAGKTSFLYQVKLGERITTVPTIGFNVEDVQAGSKKLTIWDVGGQDKIRPLWRHYYDNSNALLYMVDVSAPERFDESMKELGKVIGDMAGSTTMAMPAVLIAANKMDNLAKSEHGKVLDALRAKVQGVAANYGQGPYEVIAVSAKTGDGVDELVESLALVCGGKNKKGGRGGWAVKQGTSPSAASGAAAASKGEDDE